MKRGTAHQGPRAQGRSAQQTLQRAQAVCACVFPAGNMDSLPQYGQRAHALYAARVLRYDLYSDRRASRDRCQRRHACVAQHLRPPTTGTPTASHNQAQAAQPCPAASKHFRSRATLRHAPQQVRHNRSVQQGTRHMYICLVCHCCIAGTWLQG